MEDFYACYFLDLILCNVREYDNDYLANYERYVMALYMLLPI